MKNDDDNIATKSDYTKQLENNYYKNVQRIIILKKITIITFACFIIIMTILVSKKLIDDRKSSQKQPPKAETLSHLDHEGNVTTENHYVYLWDEKNDIVYQYLLTNEMILIPMTNDDDEWLTREELIATKIRKDIM